MPERLDAPGTGPPALVDRVLVFVPQIGRALYSLVITNAAAGLAIDPRSVRAALTELAAGRRIVVESRGGYDYVRRGDGAEGADYPLRPRPLHRTQPPMPRRPARTRAQ